MKEVTGEETLPVQYHKVTAFKCQILFAQLKTINLATRNKSLWYSFPFSANFHGVFFTKSKPRREQLVITKKKKTLNKLHSILCNFWVVRFSNPFIWSQLFCLFVFKYCCFFCRAICIKGMKKQFFACF